MSLLIRLYPQAWRDRYETEMVDLLAARRLSLAVCGTLATAALRAGVASRGRWILLAASVFLPLLLVAAITLIRETTGVALVDVSARATALFGLPYGLAWLLVGLRMTVRGSQTFVDQPSPATPGILVELEIPT